jgi:hypothetical protein
MKKAKKAESYSKYRLAFSIFKYDIYHISETKIRLHYITTDKIDIQEI